MVGNPAKQSAVASADTNMNKQNTHTGYEVEHAGYLPSHVTGLSNKNIQSASFKMLEKALETGDEEMLTSIHSNARAPKIQSQSYQGMDPGFPFTLECRWMSLACAWILTVWQLN